MHHADSKRVCSSQQAIHTLNAVLTILARRPRIHACSQLKFLRVSPTKETVFNLSTQLQISEEDVSTLAAFDTMNLVDQCASAFSHMCIDLHRAVVAYFHPQNAVAQTALHPSPTTAGG